MVDSDRSPLMRAVSGYRRRARQRLGAEELEAAVRLLKELNRRLPGQNLLSATVEELKVAGARLFAEGEPRSRSRFLTAELRELFDAALEDGLILCHPFTGAVRLPDPDRPSAGGVMSREEVAAEAAQLIANLLEDAVRCGLAMPGMAVAVAEAGEGGAPGPRALERWATRWSLLSGRARGLLEVVRFAVPVAALVLGLGSAMEPGGPIRPGDGMATGQAMRELEVAVNVMSSRGPESPPSDLAPPDVSGGVTPSVDGGGLAALGDRIGVPLRAADTAFSLERVVMFPPTLYLRHLETGALVVVAEGQRVVLHRGRLRVSE